MYNWPGFDTKLHTYVNIPTLKHFQFYIPESLNVRYSVYCCASNVHQFFQIFLVRQLHRPCIAATCNQLIFNYQHVASFFWLPFRVCNSDQVVANVTENWATLVTKILRLVTIRQLTFSVFNQHSRNWFQFKSKTLGRLFKRSLTKTMV